MAFYGVVTIGMAWHFLFQRGRTGAFAVALSICALFTVYQWKQFVRRTYGQRVEKKAIEALGKMILAKKDGQITSGVALPYGGDADAVVVLHGVKFNIEIKAIESPQKVTKKHAVQAAKAGDALFSMPVIWLPRAPSNESREKYGVRVFAGDAKSLTRFLESLK